MSSCRQFFSQAPEHGSVGAGSFDLGGVVAAFNTAQQNAICDGEHHLFDSPKDGDVVRLNTKVTQYHKSHGWMSLGDARERIEQWKENAIAQGEKGLNSDKVVLSFFDKSGAWSRPWEEAGYQVYRFDIQDNPETGDVSQFGVEFFTEWFGDFYGLDIYAILAACPCTDFARSGARHFAAKDLDGLLPLTEN